MQDGISYPPLFQGIPITKGFLAGSLVTAGILSPFGWVVQVILLAAGILVFIDAIIPEGEVSIIATILAAILGGFSSALVTILGISLPWIVGIVIASIIIYYFKRTKKRKK